MRYPTAVMVALGLSWWAADARAQSTDAAPVYQSTVHARPRRDDGSPALVITARELTQRGAQNLAEALDLIPEVQVRQGGMGTRLDLRGAKQFSILLLIDGVPITEPYFGIFDVSAIPITDIVEIRVQLAPASPLEGPGGDGGIVEVTTLRAIGGRQIAGRVQGGSMPEGEAALTGRTPLSRTVGLRVSAGARFADPGYQVPASDQHETTFFDRQSQAYAAVRVEHETARGRMTADAWYGHRSFFIPPSDTVGTSLQHITDEHAARAVLGGELALGAWRLALGGYGEVLQRATDFYADYTLATQQSHQDLLSARAGAAAHLDRAFSLRGLVGTFSARLSADGEGAHIQQTLVTGAYGSSVYGELAVGVKLRWRWFTVEAAVGALVPFDHAAGTWPEAKVVLGVQPVGALSLLLIGARKGRLPTIRELYDPSQGTRTLNPEQAWHGELQVRARPHPLVSARASVYLRRVDGAIRLDPTVPVLKNPHNVNLDTIDVRGLEAGLDVARERIIGGGLTYIFEDASSATLGQEPIPNLPRHRFDAYLSSSWRRRVGGLVRFRWVSERWVQQTQLPRYQIVEVSAWAKLTEALRTSVRVDNLLDSSYQLLPGLRALPTTVSGTIEGVWR